MYVVCFLLGKSPASEFQKPMFRNPPSVPSSRPLKMEPIEGSETSDFRTQTPENYPKENILHKEHGESLKSSSLCISLLKVVFKTVRPE